MSDFKEISLDEFLAANPNSPVGNYELGRRDQRILMEAIWKKPEELDLSKLFMVYDDEGNWMGPYRSDRLMSIEIDLIMTGAKAVIHLSDLLTILPDWAK